MRINLSSDSSGTSILVFLNIKIFFLVKSAKSSFKILDVDLTHPYYIHHFDQPRYSLIPIKLNGTNYQFLSKSFMHELRSDQRGYSLVPIKLNGTNLQSWSKSFMHELRQPHWEAALRVLRYIKGTPGQVLLLPSENNLKLQAYCDSDWDGC